jgi:flagellar secretion chaperone FliS
MHHSSYLESKVLTASPQRLHLMLIEGAIRFGRQAEEALRRGDNAAAAAPLLRVIDIVGEMLAGVRTIKSELNQKIADLYWFLFRRVSEAKINSDAAALAQALRLLEFERQTWQLACEKLGGDSTAATPPPPPHLRSFDPTSARSAKGGVSWQA